MQPRPRNMMWCVHGAIPPFKKTMRHRAAMGLSMCASLDKKIFKHANISSTAAEASASGAGGFSPNSSFVSLVTTWALPHPATLQTATWALAFCLAPTGAKFWNSALKFPFFKGLATVLMSLFSSFSPSHWKSTAQMRAPQGSFKETSSIQSPGEKVCTSVHLLMQGGPEVLVFIASDQFDQPAMFPVRSRSRYSTFGLRQPKAASQLMKAGCSTSSGKRRITKSFASDQVEKSEASQTCASQALMNPPEGSGWSQKTRISNGPRWASKRLGTMGRYTVCAWKGSDFSKLHPTSLATPILKAYEELGSKPRIVTVKDLNFNSALQKGPNAFGFSSSSAEMTSAFSNSSKSKRLWGISVHKSIPDSSTITLFTCSSCPKLDATWNSSFTKSVPGYIFFAGFVLVCHFMQWIHHSYYWSPRPLFWASHLHATYLGSKTSYYMCSNATLEKNHRKHIFWLRRGAQARTCYISWFVRAFGSAASNLHWLQNWPPNFICSLNPHLGLGWSWKNCVQHNGCRSNISYHNNVSHDEANYRRTCHRLRIASPCAKIVDHPLNPLLFEETLLIKLLRSEHDSLLPSPSSSLSFSTSSDLLFGSEQVEHVSSCGWSWRDSPGNVSNLSAWVSPGI